MTKYLIVVEKTATGYSAFSPDLPGCIATGTTRDEVEKTMARLFNSTSMVCAKKVSPSPLHTATPRTVNSLLDGGNQNGRPVL